MASFGEIKMQKANPLELLEFVAASTVLFLLPSFLSLALIGKSDNLVLGCV